MVELVEQINLIDPNIFRAYDIRGVVDQSLTEQNVFLIGKAIGTKTLLNSTNKVIVARDGRLSGIRLLQKLISGIIYTGCDVIDLGLAPTPVLYFAANVLNVDSAVMLTGSHNPPDYNGLKIILSKQAIYGDQILELKDLILSDKFFVKHNGKVGSIIEKNIINEYIEYIFNNIKINQSFKNKKIKMVVDCGNGVAGVVAEKLFTKLGVDCVPLYCEVDGNFPNHHPNPGDPKNLEDLQKAVLNQKADLGIAFDGDGDRLGVIDNEGNIIWPDRYLMLFVKDILTNNTNNGSKTIIYDIKSTNYLKDLILEFGGQPLMWKTGHSLIKAKMLETNAILAGEMSGHVFFKDRWFGFDDGLYTAARLIELLIASDETLCSMCQVLPKNYSTPELTIQSSDQEKQNIIKQLISKVMQSQEQEREITTIDGLRLDFSDCWGLVRPSNTTPTLIARFEAINLVSLNKIKDLFRKYLLEIDPNLLIPF